MIETFDNAPISEALLDIKFEPSDDITLDDIHSFYESIKKDYPKKEQKIENKYNLQFNSPNPEALGETNIVGYQFTSLDGIRICQVRLDGFTFNHLKPYTKWKVFSKQAKTLWDLYLKIVNPKRTYRIALRYINRIEIPYPFLNFNDYIKNMPPIPEGVPPSFKNFFMQTHFPGFEENEDIIITETIEPFSNDLLPFLLDIDVFKTGNFNNIDIWSEFEKLRSIKNNIFDSCITDKTKELFK